MVAPLLQTSDLTLGFGGQPILADINIAVHPRDKIALVGRNGSGKSTLLKMLAGLLEQDSGQVSFGAAHAAYLPQDPDFTGFKLLRDFAVHDIAEEEHWRVDSAFDALELDANRIAANASGGERRRAALAQLLAKQADILLLDEPTNHLDLGAILWLEQELIKTKAAQIIISHDRAFLSAVTQSTLWLDRGQLRRLNQGFAAFETWRDKIWEDEDIERHKLNRKIQAEARWAVEGISARRKRNQGRLRALQTMRKEQSEAVRRPGQAALELAQTEKSGRLVLEATDIAKAFGDQTVLKPFSLRVLRGDRIALMGPNGAGKTTLLKILIGDMAPDQGHVRHGTKLSVGYFDQNRARLQPEASLWESLTLDPELGVKGASDQIMVRGQPRHVMGYLRDFLFDESQARGPVKALSGGEKARLILARLMAREVNVLVLDEPTNDLDVETLDLLEEVLSSFEGTIVLVSHDRDFVNRLAHKTLVFEGQGRVVSYAGGYEDALQQGARFGGETLEASTKRPSSVKPGKADTQSRPKSAALSFSERHKLEALPAEIAKLESEIAKLEQFLSDPELYSREPFKFAKASEGLSERQERLASAEEEWLILAEKAENLGT